MGRVLISAPYIQPVIEKFDDLFKRYNIEYVVPKVKERLSEEELLQLNIEQYHGVICGDDRFTRKVLQKEKNLKVLSKWGTGIDSINQIECEEMGIKVFNVEDVFTNAVADTVMAYILCFSRRVLETVKKMRCGAWTKLPCFALHEKTLGVIGVGYIGKAVTRRARAFGMKVYGNDRKAISKDFVEETGIEMTDKETLLQNSDFITLHCDLNSTSYRILDEKEFKMMKSGVYIINTARGPLINESWLIHMLRGGHVAGAGLDVFEKEPLPKDSPLRYMDTVILSSHNANSSPSAWEMTHNTAVNNLLRGLECLK